MTAKFYSQHRETDLLFFIENFHDVSDLEILTKHEQKITHRGGCDPWAETRHG